MAASFIISEYNPFHLGHRLQIEKLSQDRPDQAVVALMSGPFVQRGRPALLDKFARAHLALLGGVDLVLELPAVYATASAEFFATAGLALATALDPRGTLSFGSESGQLKDIEATAKILWDHQEAIQTAMAPLLKSGLPYPLARAKAVNRLFPNTPLIEATAPNDILALEYAKAKLALKSPINLHTLPRQGAGYQDQDWKKNLPSATGIRRALKEGQLPAALEGMPEVCRAPFSRYWQLRQKGQSLEAILAYRLTMAGHKILSLPDANEEIGQRLNQAFQTWGRHKLEDLILATKSKNVTYTRIQRLLLHFCLGFDEIPLADLRKAPPAYAKVLGFTPKGQDLLRSFRSHGRIPLIHSFKELPEEILAPDILAAKLYGLLYPSSPARADYVNKPILIPSDHSRRSL